jgi:hypothetical protein
LIRAKTKSGVSRRLKMSIDAYIDGLLKIEDFNFFPHFSNLMEKWRKALKNSNVNEKPLEILTVGHETFQEFFDIPRTFQHIGMMKLQWDVIKATNFIKDNNIPICNIPINIMLDGTKFASTQRKNRRGNPYCPVIYLENQGFFINGNHRIKEALNKGKTSIQGFVIKGDVHASWVTSELVKNMLLFQSDLGLINLYLDCLDYNPIDSTEVMKRLHIVNL